MTDYSNWKILKSELPQKIEEYVAVGEWCDSGNQYRLSSDDEYYMVVPLTTDELKELRAAAYAKEVDCLTAHIQRLRDQNPIPDGEIAELIAEREDKVQEIKERYPYAEDSVD